MEKVAAAGQRGTGSQQELRYAAWLALAACCACPAAWAQESAFNPAEARVAQAQADQQVRVQVQTSALPRLEAQDSGFQAPRVDVSLFPQQAAGLGAVVGMSGFSARQPQAIGLQPQRPSVDLGVRWSHKLQTQQVDITAWRRMNVDDDAYSLIQARQPVYGARFEMSLSGARKKGFKADLGGFIGLQLESGARISVKRKNGGPMFYYRTTF
jgi:hypothetical protein